MFKTPRLARLILTAGILGAIALMVYSNGVIPGLGLAGYTTQNSNSNQDQVIIEILAGSVEIQLPGSENWIAGENAQVILPGSKVRTGSGDSAQILYPSGTITDIDENSEITLKEYQPDPQNITVFLTKGRVWSSVIKLLGGESYQTESVNMVATVRGTSYSHTVRDNGIDEIITTESIVHVACIKNASAKTDVSKDNMISSNCKTLLAPSRASAIQLNDHWLQDKVSNEQVRRERFLNLIKTKVDMLENQENRKKQNFIEKIFSGININENQADNDNEDSSSSSAKAKGKNKTTEPTSTPVPSVEAVTTPEPTIEPTPQPSPSPTPLV